MTTSPLSDAEIEELKLHFRNQRTIAGIANAFPRLIAEIEAARRSESAAGYAMWDAAVEACANVIAQWAEGIETACMNGDEKDARLLRRAEGYIRSLITPKGPISIYEGEAPVPPLHTATLSSSASASRQGGPSPPKPQPPSPASRQG